MSDKILQRIQEVFYRVFETDPAIVTIDAGPEQIPKWDSLGHVAMASEVEKEFNISLDIDDMMVMENINAIVQLVASKINND